MKNRQIEAVAQSIRALSMDAIQQCNSGHPGLPLGSADIGAVLYSEFMKINPEVSNWIDRDRFVLSAGHGSMLLYSLLHLSGFDLSLEDLKNFRRLNSKTPGHPEYGHTDGVEATTGPLGAGISNSVGMAIAETMLAEKFNTDEHKIIDHYTYTLAGDGCMMEGLSYEATALAGHLGLGKLIILFDSNSITIEGSTALATSENTIERFKAVGWQTLSGDGNDIDSVKQLISEAKSETTKPTLIELKTTIGFGSPNRAGTSGIHGSPLGDEEIKKTREALGIPVDSDFYINPLATELFTEKKLEWSQNYSKWAEMFKLWADKNPELKAQWDKFFTNDYNLDSIEMPNFKIGDKIATRKSGGTVLNAFAKEIPNLIGGSADLTPSTNTGLIDMGNYSKDNRGGRNINFGIREHAMGGIMNGMALHGIRSFGSTFLVFSDYMRPTLRLAALMNIGSIFIFTHDSIFVGEDGPTHQPIEQIESIRSIPNLTLLRPADAQECSAAYKMALKNRTSPTVIILSRQNLEIFQKENRWEENYNKGAYIAYEPKKNINSVIVATGSEVTMAIEAAKKSNKGVRVVSISSRKLFAAQNKDFKEKLLPVNSNIITVEAGITSGWEGLATTPENSVGINNFGLSGTGDSVAQKIGFTVENLLNRL